MYCDTCYEGLLTEVDGLLRDCPRCGRDRLESEFRERIEGYICRQCSAELDETLWTDVLARAGNA